MNLKSNILVFVQFSTLGYLLLSGPAFASPWWLLMVEIVGIIIGVSAVYTVMSQSKIRVKPDVHPQATLVSKGIYRWIRHPMYLAILLTVLPLLINDFTLVRLVIFLTLFINLLLKIQHEENLLNKHFPNYKQVHAKTKRLVPYVW